MTIELFQDDPYLRACDAVVVASDSKGRWFTVDQTVFYPMGGGQPGDSGVAFRRDDSEFEIADTRWERETGEIRHIAKNASDVPEPGTELHLEIDWERRYLHMRVHSCLHLLCAVVPGKVTGGQVRAGRGRLDFDVRNPKERHHLDTTLNTLIQQNARRINRVYTPQDLEASPSLVRNLSVQPPPGMERIRMVHFENLDIQPCGGTHVANTGEIGEVRVERIENKGKRNRRITVSLVDRTVDVNY